MKCSSIILYILYCSVIPSVFGHDLQRVDTFNICAGQRCCILFSFWFSPHLVDPGDERGNTGKDCGLLGGITPTSIHKTSYSFNVPFSISAFTVQRTA